LFAVSALSAALLLTVIWRKQVAPAETSRALVLAH